VSISSYRRFGKIRRIKFLSVFVLLALLLSVSLGAAAPWSGNDASANQISSEVEALLNDYSAFLSSGTTASDSSYSEVVKELVRERRSFYEEFFDKGLVCDLVEIKSEFHFEIPAEQPEADALKVEAVELVTLSGNNRLSSPNDYPPIKAARWALTQNPNNTARKQIKAYLESTIEGVKETIENGFEVTMVLDHDLLIRRVNGVLQIAEDPFTDENPIDNPGGLDVIVWENGNFVRVKPDFAKMPEALLYGTPVQQLGKPFLKVGNETDINTSLETASVLGRYNRTAARNYINTYTSNTSKKCAGTSILQDTAYYNPAYQTQGCADCANYVSQALNAGGIPRDTTWKPYTYAWINVTGLVTYLQNKGYAEGVLKYTELTYGDIATTGNSHVVMVGGLAPYRYSAHTHDRKLYSWSSSLVYFYRTIY